MAAPRDLRSRGLPLLLLERACNNAGLAGIEHAAAQINVAGGNGINDIQPAAASQAAGWAAQAQAHSCAATGQHAGQRNASPLSGRPPLPASSPPRPPAQARDAKQA